MTSKLYVPQKSILEFFLKFFRPIILTLNAIFWPKTFQITWKCVESYIRSTFLIFFYFYLNVCKVELLSPSCQTTSTFELSNFVKSLKQGSQMVGLTAQNLVWGSLRLWWAANFFGFTTHKIWRLWAESGNFWIFCSKNIKNNINSFFKKGWKKVDIFFKKVNLPWDIHKSNKKITIFGLSGIWWWKISTWAEFYFLDLATLHQNPAKPRHIPLNIVSSCWSEIS